MRQTIIGFSILLVLGALVYLMWDKDWIEEYQNLFFVGFIVYKVVRWIDNLFGENKSS